VTRTGIPEALEDGPSQRTGLGCATPFLLPDGSLNPPSVRILSVLQQQGAVPPSDSPDGSGNARLRSQRRAVTTVTGTSRVVSQRR